MKRIVVTGAGGQVGHELCRANWPANVELVPFARTDLDISARSTVAKLITGADDLVINVAAYTAVDRAETEGDRNWQTNAVGPAVLAERCAHLDIPLLHLSTDYVFAGAKQVPYEEDDETGPLNAYGKSKLAGEGAIRAVLDKHIILRTSSVFGESGPNFVKSMLRLGSERESLRIVADQVSCPTAARDIAAAIVTLSSKVLGAPDSVFWGTYHFCGQPAVTWLEFATEIFKAGAMHGARVPELIGIPAYEYRTDARRPTYSVMACEKIGRAFDIRRPDWSPGLIQLVGAILHEGN